tara:strand:- start:7050 stop:7958 length:909 start_codon:yes stop_codon:yes gene_type:complete
MKILITGSSGQLGRSLLELSPIFIKNEKINLVSISSKDLDFNNIEDCKKYIDFLKPDWIINTAAYTQVDHAESNFDLAFRVNGETPKAFAQVLKNNGGRILQISTDYVFDGFKNTPYIPLDKRNPLCVYGQSKAFAEEYIEECLSSTNQGFILRSSWLISPSGDNFIFKMLKLLDERENLQVVSDQIGCSTSTIHLASVCWEIIRRVEMGDYCPSIMHWSDSGVASWFDIAIAISQLSKTMGLITMPAKVIPIKSSEYITKASRPNFSLLDSSETSNFLDIEQTYWRSSLLDILNLISKNQL